MGYKDFFRLILSVIFFSSFSQLNAVETTSIENIDSLYANQLEADSLLLEMLHNESKAMDAMDANLSTVETKAVDEFDIKIEKIDTLQLDPLCIGVVDNIILINRVELPDSTTLYADDYKINPNYLFIPIIFEKQKIIENNVPQYKPKHNPLHSDKEVRLEKRDKWLQDNIEKQDFANYHINKIIYSNPEIVKYNLKMLPEPPKEYVIINDPTNMILSIGEIQVELESDAVTGGLNIKPKKWVTGFESTLQFSQAYLSDNWYQGGEGNLNVIGNFLYSFNLNPNVYTKVLFENSIQYNIAMNSAPQDSLRGYAISADLLQINSKFGLKAIEKWYYSATLLFKTQIFQNYTANTNDLTAAFLTPGELNIGLGMTYDLSESDKKYTFSASISPLSYNLKTCIDTNKSDFADLGYSIDKRVQNSFGSSAEGNFVWNINAVFTYTSRLYMFTDYGSIQGDWENTLSIIASKYLSTNLYVHLRYDDSATPSTEGWKYWQLKEILSFGFNYKF
ncbi:MAG: DUF3078 domain-containing protein [Bacteroidales bacterium]